MEPAKVATPTTALKPFQVVVMGKIAKTRRHEGTVYTHVLAPAPDAYSRPAQLEIRSQTSIGQKDEEIRVTCFLGGYGKKPFRFVDKETGETRMIENIVMTLDLVG